MTKMFRDGGFLTKEGEAVVEPMAEGLMRVLASEEVGAMSVAELQTLQANLAKMVGDCMSAMIYFRNKREEK